MKQTNKPAKKKIRIKAGAPTYFKGFKEYVPIKDLKPHPKNPRDHKGTIEALATSIRKYGFNAPVIALLDGTILAGHARVKAAQAVGLYGVPVIYVELNQKDALAYLLADNKVGELTDWDDDMLAAVVATFSIPPAGFSEVEFDALLAAASGPKTVAQAPFPQGNIQTVITCPKCGHKFEGKAIKKGKKKEPKS